MLIVMMLKQVEFSLTEIVPHLRDGKRYILELGLFSIPCEGIIGNGSIVFVNAGLNAFTSSNGININKMQLAASKRKWVLA